MKGALGVQRGLGHFAMRRFTLGMDTEKITLIPLPSRPTGDGALNDDIDGWRLDGGQQAVEASFEAPAVIINFGLAEELGLEAVVLPPQIGDIRHLYTLSFLLAGDQLIGSY
jgi:hypothetical protein